MKKLLITASILLIVFVSCTKDNVNDEKAITIENIIGVYKVTGYTESINGGLEEDFFADYDTCAVDDLHFFKVGDVFEYVDAGVKCIPNGDENSLWTLSGNTILFDGGSRYMKVSKLTAKQLIVTTSKTNGSTTTIFKYVYTRQ